VAKTLPVSDRRFIDVRRAIAGLRAHVEWLINDRKGEYFLSRQDADTCLAEFDRDPRAYLAFDGATASWMFDRDAFDENLDSIFLRAIQPGRERADAARIHSLEDWLRADIEGTLQCRSHASGTDAIGGADRETLYYVWDRAEIRQRSWPRLCVTCRQEYRPDAERGNVRSCVPCLDARRGGKRPNAGKPRPT
jgi:hypothetical protein